MEQYQSARKFGISIILLTLLFRLFEQGLPQKLVMLAASYIPTDKETGQNVRSLSVESWIPVFVESPPPVEVTDEPPIPVFRESDAESLALTNTGHQQADAASLVTAPLDWHLAGEAPTVLIYHTHTTESYAKNGEMYTETAAYRTLDEHYNMLSIGDRVAELLEAEGIRVIHDRELHDYPSYTGAYSHARKSLQAFLLDNPSIQLILDLHRDAAEAGGKQLRTHAAVRGQDSSQLMLVLGTGNANLPNAHWEDNAALALKLQTVLEQQCPGITRPLSLRPQRFNQDLGPKAILVEVGAAGDTHEAALLAAQELAEAIAILKNGAVCG